MMREWNKQYKSFKMLQSHWHTLPRPCTSVEEIAYKIAKIDAHVFAREVGSCGLWHHYNHITVVLLIAKLLYLMI